MPRTLDAIRYPAQYFDICTAVVEDLRTIELPAMPLGEALKLKKKWGAFGNALARSVTALPDPLERTPEHDMVRTAWDRHRRVTLELCKQPDGTVRPRFIATAMTSEAQLLGAALAASQPGPAVAAPSQTAQAAPSDTQQAVDPLAGLFAKLDAAGM